MPLHGFETNFDGFLLLELPLLAVLLLAAVVALLLLAAVVALLLLAAVVVALELEPPLGHLY
jgi:hypothetical protein